MAKVKTKIGNDYCPQALFLYGTKQEDGQPHFGLFCWFGYYHSSEGLGVMACIGEEKQTKDLIRKNGAFSANLDLNNYCLWQIIMVVLVAGPHLIR